MITVIYPCHNRLDYTKMTLPMVIAECLLNSDIVEKLIIYNDNSTDGTEAYIVGLLAKNKTDLIEYRYFNAKIGNSTFQINNTVDKFKSNYYIKIDNDILIPKGYIRLLFQEMEKRKDVGFMMVDSLGEMPFIEEKLIINKVSHIGGVGIFRGDVFEQMGEIETERQFFGFTHYQNQAKLKGWICAKITNANVMELDGSPIYSQVKRFTKLGYSRNLWQGINSISDI